MLGGGVSRCNIGALGVSMLLRTEIGARHEVSRAGNSLNEKSVKVDHRPEVAGMLTTIPLTKIDDLRSDPSSPAHPLDPPPHTFRQDDRRQPSFTVIHHKCRDRSDQRDR